MTSNQNTAKKQRRGRPFARGSSGNAKGRPRGSRNRATILLSALTEEDSAAILRSVINKARKGDITAAKVILDRISPVPRGRMISFPMPKINDAASVLEAHAAMLDAVAAGEVSIDEGLAFSGLLTAQLKTIEATEIEGRLRALEEQFALQPHRQERPLSW